MNPYVLLGSRIGTREAASLAERLAAWHDSMVAHERRLRTAPTDQMCDDECPHVEARTLWIEAVATFGDGASELRFLRSRATPPPIEAHDGAPATRRAAAAAAERRSSFTRPVVIGTSGGSSTSAAAASRGRSVEV